MTRLDRLSANTARRRSTACVAALLLGLGAAPGHAADAPQTVRLGAGEHADFSRVVLNVAPPAGWRAREVDGGVEIVLPGLAPAFDDQAVTVQRRAHRVGAAEARREADATVLRLDYSCACSAKVYALRGSMIVVDVADGAPAVAEAAPPALATASAAPEAALSAGDAAGRAANAVKPASTPKPGAAPAPVAAPKPIDISARPDRSPRDAMQEEVARAREMLLRQLQRAADEGFVRFREDPDAAKPAPVTKDGAEATPEKLATADAAHPAPGAETPAPAPEAGGQAGAHKTPPRHDSAGAAAQSHPAASDAPLPAAAHGASPAAAPHAATDGQAIADGALPATIAPVAAAPQREEPACPDETLLSPEFWLDDRPFHEGLAAHRAALYDGLNRVDAQAARDMAGFYLGHGLGMEAALMTRAFPSDTPGLSVLADAGRIIDGVALAEDSPFLRRTPCEGKAALWQAAALSGVDKDAAVKAFRASGRAIARTPEPLRRLLGERIALAAARVGDVEAAAAILALLARNLDVPTDGMRMANAALAVHEGRTLAAQTEFERVLERRGEYAVAAAVALADTLVEPVYAARAGRLADVLDGLALQHRFGPQETRVVRSLASLQARYGELREALTALDGVMRRRPEPAIVAELSALRMDLLEREVTVVTEDLTRAPDAARRLVAATEAVRALPGDARSDAMRAQLARHLIDTHAPKVASLVVDKTAAERSPELAALRADALERTALLEKLGSTDSSQAGLGAPMREGADDSALRTGDFVIGAGHEGGAETGAAAAADDARQSLRSSALSRYTEGAPPPAALMPQGEARQQDLDPEVSTLKGLFDRETGEAPPAPTSADEGRKLLNRIDAEINFFKGIADDG